MVASVASATVLVSEDFSYADGSLVPNGGWANHSGNAGDLMVEGGKAKVEHGAPSEDAHVSFADGGGTVWFAFDFSVDDPGAVIPGTDNEYFAHLMDDGFGFRARIDVVPADGGGDFSIGLSTRTSTATVNWPVDLVYGTTYRIVASYDQVANIAQLWIDASQDTDLSILGTDEADNETDVVAFALRQSDSDENETVWVDNLIVADDCSDVFSCGPVATDAQSFGSVKSLFR